MVWRDGSVVKSTDCFSRVQSPQPHGGSQPSVMRSDTPSGVSEDSYSVLTYNNKSLGQRERGQSEQHWSEQRS